MIVEQYHPNNPSDFYGLDSLKLSFFSKFWWGTKGYFIRSAVSSAEKPGWASETINNGKKKKSQNICTHITLKNWARRSGFVRFWWDEVDIRKSYKFELNQTESFIYQLCSITTFKQMELESPGWTGFVKNWKPDKTWPTGTF